MSRDVEPGQLVAYRPRSRATLEKTSSALDLAVPPTGVQVATPASGAIWTRVQTRRRRGKTESRAFAVTDGMVYAGLGLLALYELDKAVSAWGGSLGADLSGINPLNWAAAGFNAASAASAIKAAAAKAAESPPVATSPGTGSPGSNVGYVANSKLGGPEWQAFWADLGARVDAAFRGHRLEIPPAA